MSGDFESRTRETKQAGHGAGDAARIVVRARPWMNKRYCR